MELKEGYKNTEVGLIPEDWDLTPLGDIMKFKNGLNKESKYFGYGTPIINYMDVFNNYGIRNEDIKGRVYLNFQEIRNFSAIKGDVFFTRTSETQDEIGMAAVLMEDIKNCVFSGFVLRGRPYSDKVGNEYFQFCLTPQYFRSQIISQSSYTTRALTNGTSLSKVKLAHPRTLTEQKAIAQLLSDTDALIQALENKIDKKKLIKKGAMQKLLTPKEGWKIKSLADIGESIIGLTYSPADVSSAGTLVLRSSNIQGNKLAFEDNVFVNMELPSRVIVKENDLLICVRNGSKNLIGKCALINKKAEGSAFGAFMSVFRSDFAEFVFQVFQSSIIQKQIEEVMGATINQITNKNLASFSIPFPPKQEQIRIAKILSDMDNEIDQLEQKLSKYKELKQGMMQQLLTGKIRLEKFKNNAQEDNLAMAAEPNESYQRKN